MATFIFVAGAPGVGKSVVSAALRQRLDSPLFEFGWIPEFRNTGHTQTTYEEDEALAFENLVLVAKNYAAHKYQNVIITDLENHRIEQLDEEFSDYSYHIFTLRQVDEDLLKKQILDQSRSSGYRDWEQALRINKDLLERDPLKNESFIDVGQRSIEDVVDEIEAAIK
ncbi:hypothetical protein HJC99_00950 [Candidatus Saccharibacteria bacterium]|nr:hypothetical protein [Candidatus Saccharibacteria bacterium]